MREQRFLNVRSVYLYGLFILIAMLCGTWVYCFMNNKKTAVKVALFSDLHLEMAASPDLLGIVGADIIVLAGDIASGVELIHYAARVSEKNDASVVVIAGNHEYYGYDMPVLLEQFREQAKQYPQVHFLENDAVIIKGVRFLGATLWSDFTLFEASGASKLTPKEYQAYSEARVNDFFRITYHGQPFNGERISELHKASRQWLEQELSRPYQGKTVVVTHFAPHPDCLADKWQGHPEGMKFAPYFISDQSMMIQKYQPDYWFYGHTHDNIDVRVGKTRITSNQQGYPGGKVSEKYQEERLLVIE